MSMTETDKYHPRANRVVSVLMGILATVGWIAVVVLIGEQS